MNEYEYSLPTFDCEFLLLVFDAVVTKCQLDGKPNPQCFSKWLSACSEDARSNDHILGRDLSWVYPMGLKISKLMIDTALPARDQRLGDGDAGEAAALRLMSRHKSRSRLRCISRNGTRGIDAGVV